MENKVLVKLTMPEIDESFDIFIPVNETLWKVVKMMIKSINDIINTNFNMNNDYVLINKDNSRIYKNNEIVIETDIRNATELILISK